MSHSASEVAFWRGLARRALRLAPTPFYLFSVEPIREALAELAAVCRPLPVPTRHWLSCKTQPVRPLLAWWRRQGHGIEVVSEFELRAALAEGFTAPRILVNGPAKQRWLPRVRVPGLWVTFDSRQELAALLPLAKRLRWRVGIRCHTGGEHDPEHPASPTQFGFLPDEAVSALRLLKRASLECEVVHFHLRTNVAAPRHYGRALAEVADVCRAADAAPRYLDCGGGWPPHHIQDRRGRALDAAFAPRDMAPVYREALRRLPSVTELWLENGRFVSARSGLLAVRVLEVKPRGGRRDLICDGGRTTSALVSSWEDHELLPLAPRRAPDCPTTVCGPTCMAFDQLARRPLPGSIRAGDVLLWLDAGAYHVPWETRFSHGWAAVVWHDGRHLSLARAREPFASWWGQWR